VLILLQVAQKGPQISQLSTPLSKYPSGHPQALVGNLAGSETFLQVIQVVPLLQVAHWSRHAVHTPLLFHYPLMQLTKGTYGSRAHIEASKNAIPSILSATAK